MRSGKTVLLAACVIAGSAFAGEPRSLYEVYWDSELRQDPFQATTSGDSRVNDRVPDVGESAQRDRLRELG